MQQFCRVVELAAGGVSLSEPVNSQLALVHAGRLPNGERFRVYLEHDRHEVREHTNVWLWVLGDRLGVDLAKVREWRPFGDALVTGETKSGSDDSVPAHVLSEARECGLLLTSLGINGFADELPGSGLADVCLVGTRWRVAVEVVLSSGQAQNVAIWIIKDEDSAALEFTPGRLLAFRRGELRSWLHDPGRELISDRDGAGFVWESTSSGERPAVMIPGAPVWALPPRIVSMLSELA